MSIRLSRTPSKVSVSQSIQTVNTIFGPCSLGAMIATLDPRRYPCVVHSYHSPTVWRCEAHHVIPLAWTKALRLPDSRTVALCGTGHDTLHIALAYTISERPLPYRLDPDMKPLLLEALEFYRANVETLRGLPFTSIE